MARAETAGGQKIEGRISVVVLDPVRSHLQGAVQDDTQSQLLGQRCPDPGLRIFLILEAEGPRREVHGTGQSACKGQDRRMRRRIASILRPGIPLLSPHPLLGHQIGPRALQPRGHDRFVTVDHDPVARRGLHDPLVVAHAVLTSVSLSVAEHAAAVSRLDDSDTELPAEGKGSFQLRFVVLDIAGRLVMGDETYPAGVRMTGYPFQIEIRRRRTEVEIPRIPALVPTFGQHRREAVFCCKVHIADHVLRRSAVLWRFMPGIVPHVDSPPDAQVVAGADPLRGIGNPVWLVQVEQQPREQQLAGIPRNEDHAPGRDEGCADKGLDARLPGGRTGMQSSERIAAQIERGIIDERSLVESQVETVGGHDRKRRGQRVGRDHGPQFIESLIGRSVPGDGPRP